MTARFTTRQVEDVSIVDVAGRVTVGGGSNALREMLCELTSRGMKMILVNLSELSYIDSSGFGELVSAFKEVTHWWWPVEAGGLERASRASTADNQELHLL